ncbi:guanylate kinase [Bacteroidia bacterium]|nr:guanylate kinase [Bacteroidia bacterium]
MQKHSDFTFSISATTRSKRPNEEQDKDYFFMSINDFQNKIAENAFVEWQMVYENCYYGTLKSEVEAMLNNGINVLFDVDVLGGLNIKKIYGSKALAIFVQPPSIETLTERLLLRQTETPETLAKRIAKAEYEMSFLRHFDAVITNDDLDTAVEKSEELILNFLNK